MDITDTSPNEATGSERLPDFDFEFLPESIESLSNPAPNEWHFVTKNKIKLHLQFLSDQLFRLKYSLEFQLEQSYSYALDPNSSFSSANITIIEKPGCYELITKVLQIIIDKKDLKLTVQDKRGLVLLKQSTPFYARKTINKGWDKVKLSFDLGESDSFWGLGDKTCPLNLRGEKLENWNTDSFAYGDKTDPLYRSIPFFYSLRQNQGFGIFLHNTFRSHFDFGKEDETQFSFWADGGEMDFFFIYGPQLNEVSKNYHQLTGLPELPPMWALGFHQCRWSYYPASRVRELAKEFREHKIPCDAIYLDIDYMEGYRCFTWNKDYFPNPKGMIADLKKEGFNTVVMIDPGIRVDSNYWVYKSGMEQDVFCKRTSGELMIGPVWPPACVFPDFTSQKTRNWWGELYRGLYEQQDVSGFWNDMNEPAVFKVKSKTFPDQVLHYNEGQQTDHKRIHNVYGLQMTRASYQGFKKIKPQKRPFLLTRATFSGGQRFAAVWTGDNIASWEHLHLASTQCQRLSSSGFSFCGTDIGGFERQPDGELFVRWLQLGVFHYLFRVHSMGNNFDGANEVNAITVKKAEQEDRMDQEPWSFGEPFTTYARTAINFRYQLLPFIYSAFWQHLQKGESIIKSLVFFDQSDPELFNWESQFIFNDQLLVCPITESQVSTMDCYLPKGKWLDYWEGSSFSGKKQIQVSTHHDRLPIFVRAGAIIPNYPIQQFTGEKVFDRIELRVYAGESGISFLYEDEGEGYGYQEGQYSLRQFSLKDRENKIIIRQNKSGQFQTAYKAFSMTLFGIEDSRLKARVDGSEVELNIKEKQVRLTIPADFLELEISSLQ